MTTAAHFRTEDDQHAVLLSALRVMVENDGDTWFARGIEIDYAAAGTSLADVRERFVRGLQRTIEENLKRYNSIQRILRWAPEDVVAAFQECERTYELTHVSAFDLSNKVPSFPYHQLVFAERAPQTGNC